MDRLKLMDSPTHIVSTLLEDGVLPLGVSVDHALKVAELPLLHRDPFDRLLVAQALVEGLTLVTADANVLAYGVPSIDARK